MFLDGNQSDLIETSLKLATEVLWTQQVSIYYMNQ